MDTPLINPPVKEFEGTLSQKGLVTIPQAVRRHLKVKRKDKIIFRITEDAVEIRPRRLMSLEDIKGSIPALNSSKDWKQIRAEKHDDYAERYLQNLNA
ncbi:MAG: hypothetical protein FOGNACKC_02892 [Anaerolineae bacterium]|nr:hypothetical protein [Anaerolineae bacterium]